MSVTTFEQPNSAVAPHATDPVAYKNAIEASVAVCSQIGGAFAPHERSPQNMTVVIDAGRLMAEGVLVSRAQQITATIAAPALQPRIDRVVIDEVTGVVSVVTGVEAASPAAPAIPAGKLPCAQIALVVGMTFIDNSVITDERVAHAKVATGAIERHKTADTNRSNSTSVLQDPHLHSYSMEPGSRYRIEGVLACTINTTADIQLRFAVSNPNTGIWPALIMVSNLLEKKIMGINVVAVINGSVADVMEINGVILSHDTLTSVLSLDWGPYVSAPASCALLTGSWLRLTKLVND